MRFASGCGGNFFAKFEFDAVVGDGDDAPATDNRAGSDVEFLAHAGAQDADQVVGVRAGEGGVVVGEFVGDPSAAGHERLNLSG